MTKIVVLSLKKTKLCANFNNKQSLHSHEGSIQPSLYFVISLEHYNYTNTSSVAVESVSLMKRPEDKGNDDVLVEAGLT